MQKLRREQLGGVLSKSDNKSDKKKPAVIQAQAAGMLGRLGQIARQLPGAEFAEEQLQGIEARAMRELKHRLDAVDDRRLAAPEFQASVAAQDVPGQGALVNVDTLTPLNQKPGDLLNELLERAEQQDQAQAWQYLYSMILRELVPDEARILGALSEGDTYPLIHVGIGAPIGSIQRVAENFSTVGKAAAVKLREMTPTYISHLRNLDLVETGPEDKDFEIQYQILERDRLTKPAVEYAEKNKGPGKAVRFMRRVIRISPLGKDVWGTRENRSEAE